MTTASELRTKTTNTRDDLTYIDTVINTAAEQGLFKIIIEGQYMDENMANKLRTNYGYNVMKKSGILDSANNDYISYVITW